MDPIIYSSDLYEMPAIRIIKKTVLNDHVVIIFETPIPFGWSGDCYCWSWVKSARHSVTASDETTALKTAQEKIAIINRWEQRLATESFHDPSPSI